MLVQSDPIKQRCPTLSPIATCGDRQFKCGDKHNFLNFMFLAIFKILNNMYKKLIDTFISWGISEILIKNVNGRIVIKVL